MNSFLWRERWIPALIGLVGLGLCGLLAGRELDAALSRQDMAIARIATGRLDGALGEIADWTSAQRDSLASVLTSGEDSLLDSLTRNHPLVVQAFRIRNGQLSYPDSGDLSSAEELAFRERSRRLWTGHAVVASRGRSVEGQWSRDETEWIPWHWEDGLHILVRRRLDDTTFVGMELDRTALLSRLVGEVSPRDLGGGSIDLVDGSGRLLNRWGSFTPDSSQEGSALAHGNLSSPFETWSLEVRGPESIWMANARATSISTILGRWVLAALVWLVGVFLVSREWTRTLREARLKTGFVQQVSHELRTPLTNIRLHAELARDGTLEDDTYRHLEVVGQETERLSRLVSNILAFARSEKAPLQIHRGLESLPSLIEVALAPFAPFFVRSGIQAERSFPEGDLDASVDHDAALQILQNLVGNAIKYAANGHWIGIDVARCSNRWEIRVRDRGPGIPYAEREAIFRPFVRLSSSITEGVAGTGIGLGIARDLARAHGGELSLESGGSGGCTFLWILPRESK